jgi:hypothetical protein
MPSTCACALPFGCLDGLVPMPKPPLARPTSAGSEVGFFFEQSLFMFRVNGGRYPERRRRSHDQKSRFGYTVKYSDSTSSSAGRPACAL